MPKRDWLGNLASALIAGAIFVCVLIIGYGIVLEHWSEHNEVYTRHKESAERQRQATADEITASCGGLIGEAFGSCMAKQIEAHDRAQTTSEDLQAQQEMALWGLWVFVAAAATTLLTGFGIYLLYETLAATRQTLREAEATTKAAEKQIAEAALTAKLELRAYLTVEPDGIKQLIGDTRAIGMVVLRNVGRLPARNVQLIVRMDRSNAPELNEHNRRQQFSMPKPGETSDRVVQPGGEMRQGSGQYIELADLSLPHYNVYVFGVALYENGYGEQCFTRFCHRYSTDSRDRKIRPNTLATESKIFINAEKARYHTRGNTTEVLQPVK